MKAKLIFIIVLGFISMKSQSQSILNSTIEWSSSTFTDLKSNQNQADAFTITTNSSEIIVNSNSKSRNFSVNSVQGSWNNLQSDGQLECKVKYGDKDGSIIIKRVSGQFSVTVDFSKYPDGMKRKFIISNYQVK